MPLPGLMKMVVAPVVEGEFEKLVEKYIANLIKRFKPRFNVLLRDDKSFPYIAILQEHEFAQVAKHRGSRDRG